MPGVLRDCCVFQPSALGQAALPPYHSYLPSVKEGNSSVVTSAGRRDNTRQTITLEQAPANPVVSTAHYHEVKTKPWDGAQYEA